MASHRLQPITRTAPSLRRWLAATVAALAAGACGGGGDGELPTTTVCLNCASLGGNARLNCETQNARTAGC